MNDIESGSASAAAANGAVSGSCVEHPGPGHAQHRGDSEVNGYAGRAVDRHQEQGGHESSEQHMPMHPAEDHTQAATETSKRLLQHGARSVKEAGRSFRGTGAFGLAVFALSTVFNTLMSAEAKLLTNNGIPVFQAVFARSLFMVLVCVTDHIREPHDNWLGNRRGLLVIRGLMGFGSVASIYATVAQLPLGDATALSFLAPLFVALTSPIFLRETPSKLALVSVPVCLGGVILVAQPSFLFHASSLPAKGVIIGLLQPAFSAGAKMCVRALRTTEKDVTIIGYMAVISTLCSGFICAVKRSEHFVKPADTLQWLVLLLGIGGAGLGNQVCMTVGLRYAPGALPAISLTYLSMVWAVFLSITLFKEPPGWLELLGSGLIIGVTLLLSIFEAQQEKRKKLRKKQELERVPLVADAPGKPDDEDEGHHMNGSTGSPSGGTGPDPPTPTTPGTDSETAPLLDGPSSTSNGNGSSNGQQAAQLLGPHSYGSEVAAWQQQGPLQKPAVEAEVCAPGSCIAAVEHEESCSCSIQDFSSRVPCGGYYCHAAQVHHKPHQVQTQQQNQAQDQAVTDALQAPCLQRQAPPSLRYRASKHDQMSSSVLATFEHQLQMCLNTLLHPTGLPGASTAGSCSLQASTLRPTVSLQSGVVA